MLEIPAASYNRRMVDIGGNCFENVLVPLQFENRYFILESDSPPVLSVLNLTAAGPEWEIMRNEPGSTSASIATKTPPGIVTVTDRATGRFVHKLRSGTETSLVFGTLRGNEVECVIRDGSLRIGTFTFAKNLLVNAIVGVALKPDGRVSMGGSRVPQAVVDALNRHP
jgi:hypothetical protein